MAPNDVGAHEMTIVKYRDLIGFLLGRARASLHDQFNGDSVCPSVCLSVHVHVRSYTVYACSNSVFAKKSFPRALTNV